MTSDSSASPQCQIPSAQWVGWALICQSDLARNKRNLDLPKQIRSEQTRIIDQTRPPSPDQNRPEGNREDQTRPDQIRDGLI